MDVDTITEELKQISRPRIEKLTFKFFANHLRSTLSGFMPFIHVRFCTFSQLIRLRCVNILKSL